MSVTPFTTEGATLQPGEYTPGPFDVHSTVWFQYTAPKDAVIAVWAEDPAPAQEGDKYWNAPRTWMYRGTSFADLISLTQRQFNPPNYNPSVAYPYDCHIEVLEGETYYIQAMRLEGDQWGDFDLHIEEYPDQGRFSLNGNFTSLEGAATDSAGVLTCDGAEDYGRYTLDEPSGIREVRTRFFLTLTGGERLIHSFGTDNRLGLLRYVDESDNVLLEVYLYPNADGTNVIAVDSGGDANISRTSLGEKLNDDYGEVCIEVVSRFSGTHDMVNQPTYQNFASTEVIVDGVSIPLVGDGYTGWTGRVKHVDVGFYYYPTAESGFEAYADVFTGEFRDIVFQDQVSLGPIGKGTDDIDLVGFDGFMQGIVTGNSRKISTDPPYVSTVPDSDLIAAPDSRPWNAVEVDVVSDTFTNQQSTIWYTNYGAHRWQSAWFHFTDLPTPSGDVIHIMGHGGSPYSGGFGPPHTWMGLMAVTSTGDLRIAPGTVAGLNIPTENEFDPSSNSDDWFYDESFCVAHLELDQLYYIEVLTDASVVWDVRCEVRINGEVFGPFSNARSWRKPMFYWLSPPGELWRGATNSYFGLPSGYPRDNGIMVGGYRGNAHFNYGQIATGRGSDHDVLGPWESSLIQGIDGIGTHNLPSYPGDPEDVVFLPYGGEDKAWIIYGFTEEFDNPGLAAGTTGIDWQPDREGTSISSVSDGSGPAEYAGEPAVELVSDGSPNRRTTIQQADTHTFDMSSGRELGDCNVYTLWAKGTGVFQSGNFWVKPYEVLAFSPEPSFTHTNLTLDSTYRYCWGAELPRWWYHSFLDPPRAPEQQWDAGTGDTMRWKHPRILHNPLSFPRFAYSDDDGSSWTHILDTDGASDSRIGGDVAADSDEGVYMDSNAAITRLMVNDGSLAAFPFGTEPAALPGWFTTAWYLEYGVPDASDDPIAVNMWIRASGYANAPNESRTSGSLQAQLVLGDSRRTVIARDSYLLSTQGVVRYVVPRSPDGSEWDNADFDDMTMRVGFHRKFTNSTQQMLNPSPYGVTSNQGGAGILHAVAWEILLPAEPGPEPQPCQDFNIASLTTVRYAGRIRAKKVSS